MITCDFETRSRKELKGPSAVGTYRYASDASTGAVCFGFQFDEDPAVYQWHRAFPRAGLAEEWPLELDELFARIEAGELIEAHNAMFERMIWKLVMVPQHGWPEVPDDQWRCSSALASSYALRGRLEHALQDLDLPVRKDMEGNRAMLKLAKPRKALKRDRQAVADELGLALDQVPTFPGKKNVFDLIDWVNAQGGMTEALTEQLYPWHEKPEDLERTFLYNADDVRAEAALSSQLRALSGTELATWQMDQRMNERGMHCDRALVVKALSLADEAIRRADEEVYQVTDGEVGRTSQRDRLVTWLNDNGCGIPNLQALTIDEWIADPDLAEDFRVVLAARRTASRTSTKKYAAMMARICHDDRIRDLLAYHGASTGRWAGRGIQAQNLPRGSVKERMDLLCDDILRMDFDELEGFYGDVMDALATAIRGALCAPPGRDLIAGDYSAVEARGTFWISGHEAGLAKFRAIDAGECPGEDIYTMQASEILGRKVTKADGYERQVWGKVPVLGCGYQMGAAKMVSYAATMGVEIDAATAERLVTGYRETNAPVVQFWSDVEQAAIRAVALGRGGRPVECGLTKWAVRGRFLHCRLPSGRLLSYLDPKIAPVETPWGGVREAVTFMGQNTYTRQWERLSTYGGKLTENVVQALCRDVMRDAMLRLDAHPSYDPVLTVHDEVVSEVDDGVGSVVEYEELMSVVPDWAPGFPIIAEAWRGKRYRK